MSECFEVAVQKGVFVCVRASFHAYVCVRVNVWMFVCICVCVFLSACAYVSTCVLFHQLQTNNLLQALVICCTEV